LKNGSYKDLYDSEETHWWHVSKRKISLTLIKRFLQLKSPRILDIGCGTGKNVEFFSRLGQVWGLDNSEHAIKLCRNRGLHNIIRADAGKIPFCAESFDVIMMLDVLEHLDEDKTLEEVVRLLKPEGLLIATVPAYQSLWSQWDVQLHHQRRYNKKNLKFVLQKNHLNILKISYIYSFLLIPAILIRAVKSRIYRDKYPSDFVISSPFINWLASIIARLESAIVIHSHVPLGLSLITVAQKLGH
jgi:SAM-dependent methyltransferase